MLLLPCRMLCLPRVPALLLILLLVLPPVGVLTLAGVAFHGSRPQDGLAIIHTDFDALFRGASHANLRRIDFPLPDSPLDDVRSVAGSIQTALPEVASRVRDAAGTVATEAAGVLQDIGKELNQLLDRLRGTLPLNITVGTVEFCMGFPEKRSCTELPPHVDFSVPEAASAALATTMPAVAQALSDVQELLSLSSHLSGTAVQATWAVPIAAMVVMIVLTMIRRCAGVLFCFVSPVLIVLWILSVLSSFLFLAVPLWAVRRMADKAGDLPGWITVTAGGSTECYSYALCCVGVHVVISLIGFLT